MWGSLQEVWLNATSTNFGTEHFFPSVGGLELDNAALDFEAILSQRATPGSSSTQKGGKSPIKLMCFQISVLTNLCGCLDPKQMPRSLLVDAPYPT